MKMVKPKPDISCAKKTGHFHLLTTQKFIQISSNRASPWSAVPWHRFGPSFVSNTKAVASYRTPRRRPELPGFEDEAFVAGAAGDLFAVEILE